MESVGHNQCSIPGSARSRCGQENNFNARSIEEIPEKYRHIFHGYKNFNLVQSKVFDDVLYSNKSIIISAPTGSGKTAVFELAIIRFLMNQSEVSNFKIVYVAPIKALCSEKYLDWSKKLTPLGVSCREATGDTDFGDLSELNHTCLVITTPEKWDSLTRKWRDYEDVFGSISLFLIDEVHLLSEDIRGPILETIVSRMKTIQFSMKLKNMAGTSLRFVAASATIPNIEDLAAWLGRNSENNVSYFRISDENRPVPLEKIVLGFSSNVGGFKFDMSLNYKLAGIVRKYSMGKPTLIFCSSRKSVEMASTELFKSSPVILSDNRKAALITLSKRLQDSKLQNLVLKGISYHHAGLGHDDRNIIEEAFRISLLLILVSTSTLAMGVNLPAHLVVIKSTATFLRGNAEEYKESALLQMIGRAGRPQYDTKGVAVIMTEQKNVKKYENLMNGRTPVESHLHKHLAEHLNSEIVLQTITDLEVAMEWIRSTYLYVRAVKSPVNYGFTAGMTRETVEKKLEEICLLQLNALETQGLIVRDPTFGMSVLATQYGRLMARYYLSFETMKVFRKIRGDETYLDVFNTIISCKEFSEFTLRVSDKKTLNSLNSKRIKFPIKGKIKSVHDKISCLIQAVLGSIPIQESSLTLDALKMCRLAERIAKCLVEYIRLSYQTSNTKIYQALLNSVNITKCLKARMWEDSEFVCKQLKKIGPVFSNLLVAAGKTTLKSLEETSTGAIEMILGKPPPFGNEIHEGLSAFPEYEVMLKHVDSESVQIVVKQIKNTFEYDGKNSTLVVGDSENNLMLLNEKVDTVIFEYGIFEKLLKIPNKSTHSIEAHLIHEYLVGVDKSATLVLNYIEPSDNNKKSSKNAKSTSRPNRSKSNNKQTSKSKSVRKAVTTKPSVVEEHNELLENSDYFENIDMLEALNDSGINSKNTSLSENQNNKTAYQEKINNFNYTERPKMNLFALEEENLSEMFEDDFDESLAENEGNVKQNDTVLNEVDIFNEEDMPEEFDFPLNQNAPIVENPNSSANELKNSEKKQKLISDFFLKRTGANISAKCSNRNQAEMLERRTKEITPSKKATSLKENKNVITGVTTNSESKQNPQNHKYTSSRYSQETYKSELLSKDDKIQLEINRSKIVSLHPSSSLVNNGCSTQNIFPMLNNTIYPSTANRENMASNEKLPRGVDNNKDTLTMDTIDLCTQPLNLCAREESYPVNLSKKNVSGLIDLSMSQLNENIPSLSQQEPLPLVKINNSTEKKQTDNLNDFRKIPKYCELEKVFTKSLTNKFPDCTLQMNVEEIDETLTRKESQFFPNPEIKELTEYILPTKQRRFNSDKNVNILKELQKNDFDDNLFNLDHLEMGNFSFEATEDVKNKFNSNYLFSSQTQNENPKKSFKDSFFVKSEPLNSTRVKENWKIQSFSDWLFSTDEKNLSKSSICNSIVSDKENSAMSPLFHKNEDKPFRKSLPMKPANIFGPISNPITKSKFFKTKSNFEIRKKNFLKMNECVHPEVIINEVSSTPCKRTIKDKLDHNLRNSENQNISLQETSLHGNDFMNEDDYRRVDEDQVNRENNHTERTKCTEETPAENFADNIETFPSTPSIDKIAMIKVKQTRPPAVFDILEIIVDSRLSKNVKTPFTLNDLDINYSNESQESANPPKLKDTNFLVENEEDKKYVYTNSRKSHRNPTSGSIVRLPVVKQENSNNDDIKQNPAKGLLSICLKPLARPHNLNKSKMLRRQKAFLVPKTKQCDRINLRKSVSQELFSVAANREFKEILNDAEGGMGEEHQVKELRNELDFDIESICDLFKEDEPVGNMYWSSVGNFVDELPSRSPFGDNPFFEEQSTLFEDVPISESSSFSPHYDDVFASFSQRTGQGCEHFLGLNEHEVEF